MQQNTDLNAKFHKFHAGHARPSHMEGDVIPPQFLPIQQPRLRLRIARHKLRIYFVNIHNNHRRNDMMAWLYTKYQK